MADQKQYSRGSNAKLAGLPYDPKRGLDWRMGWLETNPEQNDACQDVPADWKRQTQVYRNALLNPDESEVKIKLKLTGKQANALMQLCHHITLSDRRKLSASDDEAYQMHAALQELQKALAGAGY